MFNQSAKSAADAAQPAVQQPTTHAGSRTATSRILATARLGVMVAGLASIGAWGIVFMKPEMADRLKALSPYATQPAPEMTASAAPKLTDLATPPATTPALHRGDDTTLQALPVAALDRPLIGNSKQQQRVTDWLSKRYRVARDATDMLVSAAYMTAREIKLDPLLILSVMAIESRFNPFAESPVGAQGLMQVMSKVHRDKFEDHGGVHAALNPVANIRVGSLILKDYVKRGGSVEAGLKLYVGAGNAETDSGYGAKVLAEYQRLKDVSAGIKVPAYATSASAKPREERKSATENSRPTETPETVSTKQDQLIALQDAEMPQ